MKIYIKMILSHLTDRKIFNQASHYFERKNE